MVGAEEEEEEEGFSPAGVECRAAAVQAETGEQMKPKEFLQHVDEARVAAAIAAAELTTSGEIRVFVSQRELGSDDVIARAAARFQALGMTATRDRNAVLLYFIPRARKFAVIGDVAVHEKCGQSFWNEVAEEMHTRLHAGQFTDAIVRAVEKVGELLSQHFPRRPDDRDELPDAVVRD